MKYPLALTLWNNASMSIYYVYAYLREDLTPYYIGKGKGKRAWSKGKNHIPPKNKDLIQIIAHKLFEYEAHLFEKKLIALYGRKSNGTGILRNLTDGGEGNSGYVMSNETKKKISIIRKAQMATIPHPRGMLGKKHSIETKQHLKEVRQLNHPRGMLGKKHSDIVCAKFSDQRTGEGNGMYGKTQSDLCKNKVSGTNSRMVSARDLVTGLTLRVTKEEFDTYKNIKYVGVMKRINP